MRWICFYFGISVILAISNWAWVACAYDWSVTSTSAGDDGTAIVRTEKLTPGQQVSISGFNGVVCAVPAIGVIWVITRLVRRKGQT
jgi:hypothetical protein